METKTRYVPVLRSRRAETVAVHLLSQVTRSLVAPLFELTNGTLEKWRTLSPKQVGRAITRMLYSPGEMYLDLGLLLDWPEARLICEAVQEYFISLHSPAQLVLTLADFRRKSQLGGSDLFQSNGAAFRITPLEYANADLHRVTDLFKQFGLKADDVDLIIDSQVVVEHQPMRGTAARLESGFPWRSITYLGGSFPPDLGGLRKNDQHELARHEWNTFAFESRGASQGIRFGDYTVQHALQRDSAPFPPSGSIRYSSDDHFVVMRGEKLDNPKGPGYAQYIGHALLLCERSEFRGPGFSAGDAYIHGMAGGGAGTGTPETWLRASINHHVTLTAEQLYRFAA